MKLSKRGMQVGLVERDPRVGGNCAHKGTIPSKALRHAVQLLADYRHHPLFERCAGRLEVSWPQLLASADEVIDRQVQVRQRFYTRNRVDVYHGEASFEDANGLVVVDAQGTEELVSAEHFVIATGSRPYRPPELDFANPRILDSDTVLGLDHTPRRVTIYGAGVIGCEYA